MRVCQMYETSVLSADSDHAMHVVVVPQQSQSGFQVETLLEALDLNKLATTDPSNLARHIAILLSPRVPSRDLQQTLASVAMASATTFKPSSEDMRFAELMCFERLIPFEESPLSLESLAKLATTASGAGVGAYLGFVAFGSGPLLFIAVPAGMIICGAARGVAQALEEGLRERLLRWLKREKGDAATKERILKTEGKNQG